MKRQIYGHVIDDIHARKYRYKFYNQVNYRHGGHPVARQREHSALDRSARVRDDQALLVSSHVKGLGDGSTGDRLVGVEDSKVVHVLSEDFEPVLL